MRSGFDDVVHFLQYLTFMSFSRPAHRRTKDDLRQPSFLVYRPDLWDHNPDEMSNSRGACQDEAQDRAFAEEMRKNPESELKIHLARITGLVFDPKYFKDICITI